MPSIDTLLTFALAAFLLSIAPGPSNLYIMARSIAQGHKAGISAAGGMAIGSFIYVLATALGIAAIFKYSPLAYTLLKLIGAAYLIYLGYLYLRAPAADGEQTKVINVMSKAKIFRQSIIVELTNPKTALFFLAFLPQFVDIELGNVAVQLVVLGSVYALIACGCDLCVAMLSGKLGMWLAKHPKAIQWQDRFSGTILMGLGSFICYDELGSSANS